MSIPGTPKTPRDEGYVSDSQLESLPLEILVKILRHLHHDRDHFKAVFHVSPRIREAVVLAKRVHFNYVTLDAPPPVQQLPLDDSMYMEEREAIARKRMKGGDYLSFEPLFGWWPDIYQQIDGNPPS